MESVAKRCSRCHTTKPIDDFGIDRQQADGRAVYCKACRRADYLQHREARIAAVMANYWANRDAICAKTNARHAADRDAYNRSMREARRANPERFKEYDRKRADTPHRQAMRASRRAATRDLAREQHRAWKRRNPDRWRWHITKRRLRKEAAGPIFTETEWTALKAAYGERCLRCRRHDVRLYPDHVIPLSRGGSNLIGNIQPLCKPCNSSKGTKSTDYRPSDGF